MYPGANAIEFWSLVQIVIEGLLQWNMKDHKRKGTGIFGDTDAFGSTFKE